jgi:hypothetical protein
LFSGDGSPPRLLLGDGTGHFTVSTGLDPGLTNPNYNQNSYTQCAFADVNGDGSPDLVLGAGKSTDNSAVFLDDGAGNFRYLPSALPAKALGVGAETDGVVSADVNHDGHPDLLVSSTHPSYMGNWIQVLVNNGDGTFRDQTSARLPQTDDPTRTPIASVQVLDLNHDGNPDFGVHFDNGFRDEPAFYTANTRGVFHYAGTLGLPPGLWAVADINGDGRFDAVLADQQTGVVFVALQPPPVKPLPICKPGQKPTKSSRCLR